MSNKKNENNDKTKNELTVFTNEEFGTIRTIVINGETWFVGKDITKILGYTNSSKALTDHVDTEDKLNNESLSSLGQRGGWLINESGLYSLILSSKLPSAKKFKKWITSDVLPTIRKYGVYAVDEVLNDPDMLIAALTALKEERQARQLAEQKVEEQEKVITYKQTLISGFVDDIPIYEKADIINRICKKSCGGYASRYKELYKCFRENFHVDLIKKCENYNAKQEKRKDELTIIRYAEKFGYIDDLYSCCVKLYETEVKKVIEELRSVQE